MDTEKERLGFRLNKSQKARLFSGTRARLTAYSNYPSIRQTSEKNITDLFLQDMEAYTLLTEQQEYDLACKMHDMRNLFVTLDERINDVSIHTKSRQRLRVRRNNLQSDFDDIRTQFINANLPLVVSIVRSFRSNQLPFLDLIQEGNCGLIHAVDKFDYRQGTRFATYASWWILRRIFQALAKHSYIFKLPEQVMSRIKKVSQKLGKDISGITRGDIRDEFPKSLIGSQPNEKSMLAIPQCLLLDAYPLEIFPSYYKSARQFESTEEKVLALHDIDLVQEYVNVLPPRLKTIIELSWGIGGVQKMTFREIASDSHVLLGKKISAQRISQLEQDAKKMLRRMIEKRIPEYADH